MAIFENMKTKHIFFNKLNKKNYYWVNALMFHPDQKIRTIGAKDDNENKKFWYYGDPCYCYLFIYLFYYQYYIKNSFAVSISVLQKKGR